MKNLLKKLTGNPLENSITRLIEWESDKKCESERRDFRIDYNGYQHYVHQEPKNYQVFIFSGSNRECICKSGSQLNHVINDALDKFFGINDEKEKNCSPK